MLIFFVCVYFSFIYLILIFLFHECSLVSSFGIAGPSKSIWLTATGKIAILIPDHKAAKKIAQFVFFTKSGSRQERKKERKKGNKQTNKQTNKIGERERERCREEEGQGEGRMYGLLKR